MVQLAFLGALSTIAFAVLCSASASAQYGTYDLDATQKSAVYVNGGGKAGKWINEFRFMLNLNEDRTWSIVITAPEPLPGDHHHVWSGTWTPAKPGKGYILNLDAAGAADLHGNAMYFLEEKIPPPEGVEWLFTGYSKFEALFVPTTTKATLKIKTVEHGMFDVAGITFRRTIKAKLHEDDD